MAKPRYGRRKNRQVTRQYGARFQATAKIPKIGKLQADVNYLKAVVNSELYNVYANHAAAILTAGNMFNVGLDSITQGDGNNQRTGNSILPRYVTYKWFIQRASAATSPCLVRLIFFRWLDSTVPTAANILQAGNPISPLNEDITGNAKDRKILVYKSQSVVINNSDKDMVKGKFDFEFNQPGMDTKWHTKYNDAGTVLKNNLYLLVIGNLTPNNPSFNGSYRVSYHDN